MLNDQLGMDALGGVADEAAPLHIGIIVAPVDLPVGDARFLAPQNTLVPVVLVPSAVGRLMGSVLLAADPNADTLPASGLQFVHQGLHSFGIVLAVTGELGFIQDKGAIEIAVVHAVFGVRQIPAVIQHEDQILADLFCVEICPAILAEEGLVGQNIPDGNAGRATGIALGIPGAEIVCGVLHRSIGDQIDIGQTLVQLSTAEAGCGGDFIHSKVIQVHGSILHVVLGKEADASNVSHIHRSVDLRQRQPDPAGIACVDDGVVPLIDGGGHPLGAAPVVPGSAGDHFPLTTAFGVKEDIQSEILRDLGGIDVEV